MDIKDIQKNWSEWGRVDPLFAILSYPDKRGNKWQIDEFFATGKREIDREMNRLDALQIKFPRHKALDFGCGVGRVTQALAGYFDEVWGVDIAQPMIDLANKYNRYSDRCHYYLNETDNLQVFPDNSFDFIYSTTTFQHMEPRYCKAYLKEFLRLLVPRGISIFFLPILISRGKQNIFGRFRETLRILTPNILYKLYCKFKYGTTARIEMYTVSCEEIIDFVKRNGGEILDLWQKFGGYIIRKL